MFAFPEFTTAQRRANVRSLCALGASVATWIVLALPSGVAIAQCPFNVSGISSSATVASDALLLTRLTRGAMDAALTDRSGAMRTSDAILTDTDNTALRLDVNGSGVFDISDAAIIARYVLGFRGAALTPDGVGAHATRTGAEIQAFIDGGCRSKKRLIELGWNAPTPRFIKANIATMEQRPLSGTAVRLATGVEIFRKIAYPDSAFMQDRIDLAATTFTTLTDNFVSIQSASENGWRWTNDSDWFAVQTNAVNFAKTAKAGRFKGLLFDPEPYGNNPWQYSNALYPGQDFATVQAKVRQRGAAFLSAVQAEIPNVKILFLFGLSQVKLQTEGYHGGVLQDAEWSLYASFIDGMLDVIGSQVQLIDGNEQSGAYVTAQKYDEYRVDKRDSRRYVSPENRQKYDKHLRVAHIVFIDGVLNLINNSRFIGKFLSTDAERKLWLEFTTYHGLRASDEYLWVYDEDMDWWGGQGAGVRLPAGVETVLSSAVQKINASQPLGFAPTSAMVTAAALFDDKRFIGGQIKDASGQGVAGVSMVSGGIAGSGEPSVLGDSFCGRGDSNGFYACYFPRGATYTVTPVKLGYTFDPPVHAYSPTTPFSSQYGHDGRNFVVNP